MMAGQWSLLTWTNSRWRLSESQNIGCWTQYSYFVYQYSTKLSFTTLNHIIIAGDALVPTSLHINQACSPLFICFFFCPSLNPSYTGIFLRIHDSAAQPTYPWFCSYVLLEYKSFRSPICSGDNFLTWFYPEIRLHLLAVMCISKQ